MSTLTIEPIAVPLRQESDGVVRIGSSRVLLELVIRAFQRGATPESIVQSYDTLGLPEVYAVLAYYLAHQEDVDAYVRRSDDHADQVRQRIQSAQPNQADLRERLMQRAKKMEPQGGQADQWRKL